MPHLVQYSFATPTTPPLGLYTPRSAADGLTALDSGPLTAFGRVLQRIVELTTTASTLNFKWSSLCTFSRRRLTLPATPASGYYLEPTTTYIASDNSSPGILAIPLLIIVISILFGVGVVHFGQPVYKAQNEKLSPKSLYSESPTMFYQDDTVSPPASYIPRFSFSWVSPLSFILRGLAFLFRVIRMDKLLDMIEDNTTAQESATSAVSHIAELRTLEKKLVQVMNTATPTRTILKPARLHDANETLVASVSPEHAKSKLEQHPLSASDDKVDIIPLRKAYPPICTEVAPAITRKGAVTPPGAEISNAFGIRNAGATSVPLRQCGDGTNPSLPISSSRNHRSPSAATHLSVEPSRVPDEPLAMSSPLYKPSYKFSRPIFLSSGKVDAIPLSKDIMACPPSTCTEISPASARQASVASVSEKIVDTFAIGNAGARSATLQQGGDGMNFGLPTSNRRSSLRPRRSTSPPDTALAPFSVEPSCVPDEPLTARSSPLSKPSYKNFSPIHLIAGDRLSTPPCNSAAKSLSPSVDPSGGPDRLAAPLEPRAESDCQAKLRRIFERCMEDSPRQPLDPKPTARDFDAAPKPDSGYVCQAELQRIFQPCFDDPRLQPKSFKPAVSTESVRPLDPASTCSSTGAEEAVRPLTRTSQKDTTATDQSPKDVHLRLTQQRSVPESSTGAEANEPQPLIRTSQEETRATQRIPNVVRLRDRLASPRSSISEEAELLTRGSQKDITVIDHNPRDVLSTHSYAEVGSPLTSTPPHRTSKIRASPPKIVPKGTNMIDTIPNLLESVDAVRERARRAIERAREPAISTHSHIRTKNPSRGSQSEQPRRPKPVLSTETDPQAVREETPREKARNILEQIRQDHKDLLTRVQATLRYHDEKRELRANSMLSRSQDKTGERPASKLPSKLPSQYRTLAKPRESQDVATTTGPSEGSRIGRKGGPEEFDQVARLHSLLELDVPVPVHVPDDHCETSTENEATSIEQTSWPLEGYVWPADDESCGGSTAEDLVESNASPVESSWDVEDHIPAATNDDTWHNDELDDVDAAENRSFNAHQTPAIHPPRSRPRSFSVSTRSRPHSPIDQPQKIHDLFYSPTFASSPPNKHSTPHTRFLKGKEKMTGFGSGSPWSRRIQRLDERDTFETSTPRVNHAHFGGFCTSTPRRGVDNRRDRWVDFF